MAKKQSKSFTSDNRALVLKYIKPMTTVQTEFFKHYDTGKSQVLMGSSGTGKTFLSLYKALQEVHDVTSEFNRIVIVRSAVPTRDMGFLPGSLSEKGEVYELPYKAICNELFCRGDAYELLRKHRDIEFITTSFIRGITLDRAIIIVDEFQNLTMHESSSIMTRVGTNSKIIFCGDIIQTDFTSNRDKDIDLFLKILKNMPDEVDFTYFGAKDIVRSGLVKEFILSQIELGIIV